MIKYNNKEIEFSSIGLFTTNSEWIHPVRCEETYEVIYVVEGVVHLFSGDSKYTLNKGELIVLEPGVVHGGSEASFGKTSFYWLHFTVPGEIEKGIVLESFPDSYLFKKLLHYNNIPTQSGFMKDSITCHIIAEIANMAKSSHQTSIAANIIEWVRINASAGLTVKKAAEHFGYNSDYISKLIKKEYKKSLKSIIDDYIIKKANEYLLNTGLSVKEISGFMGFENANTFVNFYKYHERISPARFRNSYFATHMNNK